MSALASRLAIRGHVVTLVTLDNGQNDRHQVADSVARRPLDLMRESHGLTAKLLNTRRRMIAIRKAIQDARPDVVLSFCDRTNILVLLALARRPEPVVVCERSDPAEQQLGTFWEYQRKRTYRRAARVVALTGTAASKLQDLSATPVVVIPSAVDPPPCCSDRDAAVRRSRIIGIGRLEHEKGFDRLIQAFAIATARSPAWTLRILGEGSQREALHRLAQDLNVRDRVSLPGWVQPVWNEIAEATLFVLPSRYEGFPSALLEAMAVGVPCIAVDCESGPRAIIHHESDGLLVEATVSGLAEGIRRMIDEPTGREQMAERGKSVVERFGWDAMVDAYEQLLKEVVSQPAAGHRPSAGTGGASS